MEKRCKNLSHNVVTEEDRKKGIIAKLRCKYQGMVLSSEGMFWSCNNEGEICDRNSEICIKAGDCS